MGGGNELILKDKFEKYLKLLSISFSFIHTSVHYTVQRTKQGNIKKKSTESRRTKKMKEKGKKKKSEEEEAAAVGEKLLHDMVSFRNDDDDDVVVSGVTIMTAFWFLFFFFFYFFIFFTARIRFTGRSGRYSPVIWAVRINGLSVPFDRPVGYIPSCTSRIRYSLR